MKQITGDLFDVTTHGIKTICITTNGATKRDGSAIMGRGCAKQFAMYIPSAPKRLGTLIRKHGNNVQRIGVSTGVTFLAFPVKPIAASNTGDNVVRHMQYKLQNSPTVPGWACKADIRIIERSLRQLVTYVDANNITEVLIPRMGCGAGELSWEHDVEPLASSILDDRFTTITF